MNPSNTKAIDPIWGMTVDEATALHAERDGKRRHLKPVEKKVERTIVKIMMEAASG